MGKYDTLVSHLRECAKLDKSENTFTEAANAIEDLETRVERKKGMWLYWWDEPNYDTYECSVCGTPFDIPNRNPWKRNYKFCPNCGADMRGKDNG